MVTVVPRYDNDKLIRFEKEFLKLLYERGKNIQEMRKCDIFRKHKSVIFDKSNE